MPRIDQLVNAHIAVKKQPTKIFHGGTIITARKKGFCNRIPFITSSKRR